MISASTKNKAFGKLVNSAVTETWLVSNKAYAFKTAAGKYYIVKNNLQVKEVSEEVYYCLVMF